MTLSLTGKLLVLLKLGNSYSCYKTINMILTSIFANNNSLFMDIRFMLNTKISSARGINGLHLLLLSVMLITTNLDRPFKHSDCHYNQTKHYMCMCACAHTLSHRLNPRIAFLLHSITTSLNK